MAPVLVMTILVNCNQGAVQVNKTDPSINQIIIKVVRNKLTTVILRANNIRQQTDSSMFSTSITKHSNIIGP